jgi:SAM-dependent methyltransferase
MTAADAMRIVTKQCVVCGVEAAHLVLFSNLKDYEYEVESDEHALIRCRSCSLLSLDPMPTTSQLKRYYPLDYCNYDESKTNAVRRTLENLYARSQVHLVQRLIGSEGTVLDVGCATGKLIGLLQERDSWVCRGVEFKDEIAELGRRRGRHIITGTIELASLPPETYDLVMLNHMIEHSDRPLEFMEQVFRVLKKGGKVFIETPNADCLDYRLFAGRWGCIHFPRHTYLFSRSNISRLLERSGFVAQKVEFSLHTCGWALGLQNVLASRFPLRRLYGRMSLYPLLLLGFLPCSVAQVLAGNGSVMRVVGIKPS